jgi:hypothetical protein
VNNLQGGIRFSGKAPRGNLWASETRSCVRVTVKTGWGARHDAWQRETAKGPARKQRAERRLWRSKGALCEPELLNWFRARGKFAAGATEGFNNKARITTRKAYGFRACEHAKSRCTMASVTSRRPIG